MFKATAGHLKIRTTAHTGLPIDGCIIPYEVDVGTNPNQA